MPFFWTFEEISIWFILFQLNSLFFLQILPKNQSRIATKFLWKSQIEFKNRIFKIAIAIELCYKYPTSKADYFKKIRKMHENLSKIHKVEISPTLVYWSLINDHENWPSNNRHVRRSPSWSGTTALDCTSFCRRRRRWRPSSVPNSNPNFRNHCKKVKRDRLNNASDMNLKRREK